MVSCSCSLMNLGLRLGFCVCVCVWNWNIDPFGFVSSLSRRGTAVPGMRVPSAKNPVLSWVTSVKSGARHWDRDAIRIMDLHIRERRNTVLHARSFPSFQISTFPPRHSASFSTSRLWAYKVTYIIHARNSE